MAIRRKSAVPRSFPRRLAHGVDTPFFAPVKIIILHQHFRTPEQGGAIRSWYLARALTDRGIEVVVITGHNDSCYRRQNLEGIDVHCLPVAYDNRFDFYRRVYAFLRFAWKALRIIRQHRDARVCYAISTPLTTGLAASWAKYRHGIPYVFEVGDLWPDAPEQMGFLRNPLLRTVVRWLERHIYKRASRIVALSEPIRETVSKRAPGVEVRVIPNMADTDFYRPYVRASDATEVLVVYIGAVGMANGLEYFVDAARACQEGKIPARFVLCGDGGRLEALRRYAEESKVENLTFAGFRNRMEVRDLLQKADVNFICYAHYPVLETGSPNKYFDGLAAGKLTVVNFGGWIREELERHACGFYVDPLNPVELAGKLLPFTQDSVRLQQFQQAARALAEEKYTRKMLSEKFFDVFTPWLA